MAERIKCIICPITPIGGVHIIADAPTEHWENIVQCKSCRHTWPVCNICPKYPKANRKWSRFKHRKIHRLEAASPSNVGTLSDLETGSSADNNADVDEFIGDVQSSVTNDDSEGIELPLPANYDRVQTLNFVKDHSNGNALQRLVMKSCHGPRNFATRKMHPEELEYHLLLTKLSRRMPRADRGILARVLFLSKNMTERWMAPSSHDSSSIDVELGRPGTAQSTYVRTPQCVTAKQIDQMYLLRTDSILMTLPHPDVTFLGDHAYVSVVQSFKYCLATFDRTRYSGADAKFIPSGEWYCKFRSEGAEQFRDYSGIKIQLWMIQWSDDFEPNNTKTNRGSVWLCTVTFCWVVTVNGEEHYCKTTMPVALSRKGVAHECVERRFAEEIQYLIKAEDTYFVGPMRENGPIHAKFYVRLNDQPEKRAKCYLQGGNSTYHSRYGYSANHSKLQKVLPACDDCFQALVDAWKPTAAYDRTSDGTCPVCVCWTITSTSPLLSTMPPDHYPTSELPADGFIRPFRLTYDKLKLAVSHAVQKLIKGKWSYKEASTYLRVHCVQDNLAERFLDAAQMKMMWDAVSEKVQLDKDELTTSERAILDLAASSPEEFVIPLFPAVWVSDIAIIQHIEAIMHLLFLGVQKLTMQLIRKWTKCVGKSQAFDKYTKILADFPTVGWCQLEPHVGDKLGGWVSENYLAVSRMTKWFYTPLITVMKLKEYVDPTTPISTWKKPQCVKWFDVRCVDLATMAGYLSCEDEDDEQHYDEMAECVKLSEQGKTIATTPVGFLRELIYILVERQEGPPPIVLRNLCHVDQIMDLTRALQSAISHIMTHDVVSDEHIRQTERHIKIFLTLFARVQLSIKGVTPGYDPTSDKKEQYVAAYNLQCCLNVPDMMRLCGNLLHLSELSDQGEHYIQKFKSIILRGLRQGWELSVMLNCLRNISLDDMMSLREFEENIGREDPTSDVANLAGTHVYDNLLEVMTHPRDRLPISCVNLPEDNGKTASKTYGIVVVVDEITYVVKIRISSFATCENDCHYFLCDHEDKLSLVPQTSFSPGRSYLLLPHHSIAFPRCYHFINDRHQEIGRDGYTYNTSTYASVV